MEEPIVLKIFLIGFHHKKGCVKDSEYPPENIRDFDIDRLPSLCLPDQSHNFESDSVYFTLPISEEDGKRIFGVSCFRQIQTEKVLNRKENDGTDFSRSSVQKSVCCLSSVPLFGYIEVKLNLYVDKIFEQADFINCDELLKQSYEELNRCLSLRLETVDLNDFFIGICLRELISIWKHKILVLFKLLLLEKRVLFYGSPVRPLCTTILSIISLHPLLLSRGLSQVIDEKRSLLKTSEEIESNEDSQNCKESDLVDGMQVINLENIAPEEYFAPMNIFKNGYLCLPFISLQYIDIIADKLNNGFIAGASNVLFQQKKNLVDVLIDIPTQTIEFIDLELKKCVQLTTEDLRFLEHLTKGIDSPCEGTGIGTDQWIRKQFESYFTSMLKTNYDNDNVRDLECFNEFFMEEWRKSNNFQDWLAQKITFMSNNPQGNCFDKFPKGHPFLRQSINVSDVKNKIVQSINNTPTARKTVTAVTTTLSNAKSSFSSWFSNLSIKEQVIDIKEYDKDDKET